MGEVPPNKLPSKKYGFHALIIGCTLDGNAIIACKVQVGQGSNLMVVATQNRLRGGYLHPPIPHKMGCAKRDFGEWVEEDPLGQKKHFDKFLRVVSNHKGGKETASGLIKPVLYPYPQGSVKWYPIGCNGVPVHFQDVHYETGWQLWAVKYFLLVDFATPPWLFTGGNVDELQRLSFRHGAVNFSKTVYDLEGRDDPENDNLSFIMDALKPLHEFAHVDGIGSFSMLNSERGRRIMYWIWLIFAQREYFYSQRLKTAKETKGLSWIVDQRKFDEWKRDGFPEKPYGYFDKSTAAKRYFERNFENVTATCCPEQSKPCSPRRVIPTLTGGFHALIVGCFGPETAILAFRVRLEGRDSLMVAGTMRKDTLPLHIREKMSKASLEFELLGASKFKKFENNVLKNAYESFIPPFPEGVTQWKPDGSQGLTVDFQYLCVEHVNGFQLWNSRKCIPLKFEDGSAVFGEGLTDDGYDIPLLELKTTAEGGSPRISVNGDGLPYDLAGKDGTLETLFAGLLPIHEFGAFPWGDTHERCLFWVYYLFQKRLDTYLDHCKVHTTGTLPEKDEKVWEEFVDTDFPMKPVDPSEDTEDSRIYRETNWNKAMGTLTPAKRRLSSGSLAEMQLRLHELVFHLRRFELGGCGGAGREWRGV
jgi:hypothetical protein